MARDRPRVRHRAPTWDLNIVLEFLQGSFFEPLREAEVKFLTWKVAFLLALATASRRSELHALSAYGIRWATEGAVLRVVPGFLSKTQFPDRAPEDLYLQALPVSKDRSLCPVRALRVYLERTNSFRANRERLFLSLQTGRTHDISAQSVSSWLVNLIRMAHEKSGAPIPAETQVRAHDVRGVSTSVAWKYNVPLSSLVQSAIWRSKNSFIEFYCKDLTGWECNAPALVVGRHAVTVTCPRT